MRATSNFRITGFVSTRSAISRAMAYFGKQFKKVGADNIVEFMDAMNVSEKIRAVVRKTDSLTSFVKNGDGSLQYVVELDGNKVLNEKITLGEESDFTIPDGTVAKILFTLEGDLLKSTMTQPDGSHIYFDRYFESDKLKMDLYSDKTDVKAVVYYAAV